MSLRKKITIFVSVVILLVLILVLPFCDGILFKNKVEKLVGKVGQRYHVKLVNYKRGWFTSEFQLSMQNQLINKVETYHVTHGPFVIYQHIPEFALGKVTSNSTINNIGTTNGSGIISLFGNVTIHSQLKLDDSLLGVASMLIAYVQPNTQLKISPINITAKISSKLNHIYEKVTIPTISVVTSDSQGIDLQINNLTYTVNVTRQNNNDWIADASFGVESAKMLGYKVVKADLENLQVNGLRFDFNQAITIMKENSSYDKRQQQLLQTVIALPTIKLDKVSFSDPLSNFEASGQVSWPGFNPAKGNSNTLLANMNFNFKFKGTSGYFSKIIAAQKLANIKISNTFYYMPLRLTSSDSDALSDLGTSLVTQFLQQGYIKQADGVYTFSISKNQQDILLNNKKPAPLDAAYLSLLFGVNLVDATQQVQTLAQQNNMYAQYLLGYQYFYGIGVVKAQSAGLVWLQKSALKGNINAQKQLVATYRFGLEGVPKDMSQAIKWYKQGICYNREFSVSSLALIYLYGLGVPVDYAKAYKYLYMLSPKDKQEVSKYMKTVAKHLTKQQIRQASVLPSCLTNDIQPIIKVSQ